MMQSGLSTTIKEKGHRCYHKFSVIPQELYYYCYNNINICKFLICKEITWWRADASECVCHFRGFVLSDIMVIDLGKFVSYFRKVPGLFYFPPPIRVKVKTGDVGSIHKDTYNCFFFLIFERWLKGSWIFE